MTEVEAKPAHGESDDSDVQAKLYDSQKDRVSVCGTQGEYDLNDELRYRNALKTMLPWLPDHMAETTSAFGDEFWEYGLGEKTGAPSRRSTATPLSRARQAALRRR